MPSAPTIWNDGAGHGHMDELHSVADWPRMSTGVLTPSTAAWTRTPNAWKSSGHHLCGSS